MGPLEVVDFAPSIESALYICQILEALQGEDLFVERPMKALVLAATLRVIGAAVEEFDAELDQPHAQSGPMPARGIAPRRAVVDEDRIGQAITVERRLQMGLNR